MVAESAAQTGNRAIAADVEDQVTALTLVGSVLTGIAGDAAGAGERGQVRLGGGAVTRG